MGGEVPVERCARRLALGCPLLASLLRFPGTGWTPPSAPFLSRSSLIPSFPVGL